MAEVFIISKNFKVTGQMIPGSRLKSITNAMKKETVTLTDPNQGLYDCGVWWYK
jgi:hypothetical protein